MKRAHQKLPANGAEREALRQKGQFWTPDWIADAMVSYVLQQDEQFLFDPAVGAGAFFLAAYRFGAAAGRTISLAGMEIDPDALGEARQNGISEADLSKVEIRDFVLNPPQRRLSAIVANPPYIRHHRLAAETKVQLRLLSARLIGSPLDGRAGLHIYFLLRALELLDKGGRLAFIMPADTCEGVAAPKLWRWITRNYCLEGMVTFTAEATPFPGVDTNPIIVLIQNRPPEQYFFGVRCAEANSDELLSCIQANFVERSYRSLTIHRRELVEGLETGLSREPATNGHRPTFVLGDFASVLRGIATGANEYFFLTTRRAHELNIPGEFLRPAVGRTRDVEGDEINIETLRKLERQGRPTLLFSPDGRAMNQFPGAVQHYLQQIESQGVHRRALIASRNPWYKMETREVPPILFAYLGRRSVRFIRNRAGVVPLTGFLCVYPHRQDTAYIEKLWQVLQHPQTLVNLTSVGKSYGGDAIKVEPRALERLPLASDFIHALGLTPLTKRLI